MSRKYLIVIAGPTAIGKTAAAITLAQHYHTAILSADSRQFYREMTIGTAKPSPDELAAAQHYFINSHSVTDTFTVADFEQQALQVLKQVFTQYNLAIIAGGSGLYVKAVEEGFDELPNVKAGVRDNLNEAFAQCGISYLQDRLKIADPGYYQQVDLNNPQRLIRALEVFESTGTPYSAFRTGNKQQRPFQIIKVGLDMPREALYQRINQRVDMMLAQGLVAEVEQLLHFRHLNALNTVGYIEIFDYLDGKTSLPQAVELIKQNTRRFAKRQLTWFRKDQQITWFAPDDLTGIIRYIDSIIAASAA
ncbi:tRNA (adenosine(37)-N6)-dimethylallyltransferase MiaA [Mucilaginibacter robiniae]|uniref:tRNA dimethylallyltransferase n=1 Tax=Mucilaginibacter robiniae TaxID=2728022 RepID=A0A7L5E3H3_9SPHI|nr:tRNA (adenosine(37)-N6)-dimethylallyltransferase MiaA [Mucilaginibacter robiniae]QJD96967.1 tRNA (adenosine(37)-N6)-dimethylallyltransferase MiaA [Mucilaginibacter robiniae]